MYFLRFEKKVVGIALLALRQTKIVKKTLFILDLIHKERVLYLPRDIKESLAKRRGKTRKYGRESHKVEYKLIFLLVISLASRLYASVPF